jgi:hypothetical protein
LLRSLLRLPTFWCVDKREANTLSPAAAHDSEGIGVTDMMDLDGGPLAAALA